MQLKRNFNWTEIFALSSCFNIIVVLIIYIQKSQYADWLRARPKQLCRKFKLNVITKKANDFACSLEELSISIKFSKSTKSAFTQHVSRIILLAFEKSTHACQ